MSKIHTIDGCVSFTRGGATTFSGIGSIIPGETRLLGVRPGIGFAKFVGICKVVTAVPGAAAGTLSIQQSVDGTNWDLSQTYSLTAASATLSFSVEIVGLFIRATFTVPNPEVYSIRFGGFLDPIGGGSGSLVDVAGAPGTTITTIADVTCGAGATVSLTTPPAGTRRMCVQVIGGDATTDVRIREIGGTAGAGRKLKQDGSTMFGGLDGAVARLEAQNVTGPSVGIHIDFERD